MKTLKAFFLVAMMSPVLALATTGQYKITFQSESMGGYISSQEICIVNNGTWYSTSYPNWSGKWFKKGNDMHLHGNFDYGYGNDAFELTKILPNLMTGYWQEWMDDGGYDNYLTVKFEKTGDKCYPKAVFKLKSEGGHPADK